MQEKVQKWLDEKIAEEKKNHEEEKDNLALSLGLYDDSVPLKYFANYSQREITKETYEKDKARGYNVSIIASPIKLSDEEYNDLLKHVSIEEPAQNKYEKIEGLLEKIEKHTKVVSTLVVIYVILSVIIGLIH